MSDLIGMSEDRLDEYDVVVVGGGMAGCFAALHAARQGAEVLVVEPRTFLGREVTATLRPWIGRTGMEDASVGEEWREILGVPSAANVNEAGEIPLSLARVKKGWLNALRDAGVQVLFRSETAGVLTAGNRVGGVVVGNKSGLQAIRARAVIDATENGTVLRNVQACRAVRSGTYRRTIEWIRAELADLQTIEMPAEIFLDGDRLEVHRGSLGDGHLLVEFSFDAADADPEIAARKLTIHICEYLKTTHPGF
ncbi:MAG: FAD-dependent oxidoreductase, partial [Paenibacillaceae bacterium]|nr:FAD-dependent oxidoreductase [Paenibacillaceae bacterium]